MGYMKGLVIKVTKDDYLAIENTYIKQSYKIINWEELKEAVYCAEGLETLDTHLNRVFRLMGVQIIEDKE